MLFEKPYYYKHSIMPGYNVWENETYRLRAWTGVASSISGGGGHIHIFVFTDRKDNQFQKKLK